MGNRILNIFKKFPIHPTFLLLFLYLVITKGFESFLLFVFVVLVHEFAHAWVAKHYGYKIDNFFLTPYGTSLNYKEKIFDSKDELYVAIAGPLINIVLGIFVSSLWWAFPNLYNFTDVFVKQSFLFALFNLLPCYPLDGGRIVLSLMSRSVPREKVVKILIIFNVIFSFIMLVLFIISCFYNFNPTFALASIFMVLGLFEGKKQSKYKVVSYFGKKTKNFAKTKILYVKQNVSLLKLIKKIDYNKFTIFAVDKGEKIVFIDEKRVLSFALVYPLTISLEKILNQVRNK